MMEY